MTGAQPFLVGGTGRIRDASVTIRSPFDGASLAEVGLASSQDAHEACALAERSFVQTRVMPNWAREAILLKISEAIGSRAEEFARRIVQESGKPIRDARGEVARAVQTFRIAAEECKRMAAGVLPLDWTAGSDGRAAVVRRFPIGPVLAITPFNFPVNLVAHKLAPAIASGNPIVIKPAPQTPLSALALGALAVECGWPAEAISVLPCDNEVAAQLLGDERLKQLSFTGSSAVGWQLKAQSGKKHVTLELGGNAAVVVHSDASLPLAVGRIVQGGFSYSGQSCISVQRVFAHESIYGGLLEGLVAGVEKLVVGDPGDEATNVGPMINEQAAIRAEEWIGEAVQAGATVLTGGRREGSMLTPAVLIGVPESSPLHAEEAFAPVVVVEPYREFAEALARVNRSRYGLQAGVFTQQWPLIAEAYRTIEAGAVLINEVPTWRADQMPYGGVKDSGMGREGLASAIEAMTEAKLLVMDF